MSFKEFMNESVYDKTPQEIVHYLSKYSKEKAIETIESQIRKAKRANKQYSNLEQVLQMLGKQVSKNTAPSELRQVLTKAAEAPKEIAIGDIGYEWKNSLNDIQRVSREENGLFYILDVKGKYEWTYPRTKEQLLHQIEKDRLDVERRDAVRAERKKKKELTDLRREERQTRTNVKEKKKKEIKRIINDPSTAPLLLKHVLTSTGPAIEEWGKNIIKSYEAAALSYLKWKEENQPETPDSKLIHVHKRKNSVENYLKTLKQHNIGSHPLAPFRYNDITNVDDVMPHARKVSAEQVEMAKERIVNVLNSKVDRIDDIIDVVNHGFTTRSGDVEGTWVITYNDKTKKTVETQLITAGGYNIQIFHTRYLVKVWDWKEDETV